VDSSISCQHFFTIGFFTRTGTVIWYVSHFFDDSETDWIVNGEDLVFRMTLFYSMFTPLGHRLSVDEKIN